MFSFRMVLIPQCGQCETPATDADGRELQVPSRLLPAEVRRGLETGGWRVTPGKPKVNRGPADPLGGDDLWCPDCVASAKASAARFRTDLHRPLVKTVDMTDKLGPGWLLGQRAGDAEAHRWLVIHREGDGDTVRGMVVRYRRKSDEKLSGWEALLGYSGGFVQHSATKAASRSDRSSFLWRSRDLAAWGIAHSPGFHDPNPAWATRPTRARTSR
jgi:hypothetical protein